MKDRKQYNFNDARYRLLNALSEESYLDGNGTDLQAEYVDQTDLGYLTHVTCVVVRVEWDGAFQDKQMEANCEKAIIGELNEILYTDRQISFYSEFDYYTACYNAISNNDDYEIFQKVCLISSLQTMLIEMCEDRGYPIPTLTTGIATRFCLALPYTNKKTGMTSFKIDDDLIEEALQLSDAIMTNETIAEEDYDVLISAPFFESIHNQIQEHDGLDLLHAFYMETDQDLGGLLYGYSISFDDFEQFISNHYDEDKVTYSNHKTSNFVEEEMDDEDKDTDA